MVHSATLVRLKHEVAGWHTVGSWCLPCCTEAWLLQRLSHKPHSDALPPSHPLIVARCACNVNTDMAWAAAQAAGCAADRPAVNRHSVDREVCLLSARNSVGIQARSHCAALYVSVVGLTAAPTAAVVLFWVIYRNPLLWQRTKYEASFSCRQGRWWK